MMTWIEKSLRRISVAWRSGRVKWELQELKIEMLGLRAEALTVAEANCQRALKKAEEMCAFYKAAYEAAAEEARKEREARIEASETLADFLAQEKWGIQIYGRVKIPEKPDLSNLAPIPGRNPLVGEMRRQTAKFRRDLTQAVEALREKTE